MSCMGLGQAAQVEKLICTNAVEVTGRYVNSVQKLYGTPSAPINMGTIFNPTIVVGTVSKVTIYAYSSTTNTMQFTL